MAKHIDLHTYTLWQNAGEGRDGTVFSKGKHGEVNARPAHDRVGIPGDLAGHNILEMERAMEEAMKWEIRMKDSPLGKTQQDFVAYYADLIAVFEEWFAACGIPLPPLKDE